MITLGISAHFHDAAAALVVDGQLVAAAQEERFTRQKHDARLPVQAAAFCLEEAGLGMDDVDKVVFYEKPLTKLERIVVSNLRNFPRGLAQFTRAMRTWLGGRLFTRAEIALAFGLPVDKVWFAEHHVSHAASTWLTSGWDDAAILTVDGVGEWTTTAIFHGRREEGAAVLEPVAEQVYPHSLGLFYSTLTAWLGFAVNDGEYKLMGLAAYGEPRYLEELRRICRVDERGAIELDLAYFAFHVTSDQSYAAALEVLLGPAREPEQPLRFSPGGAPLDEETQRFADVAASAQALTEEALLALAEEAHRQTGARRLCLAGGVALNGVAVHRIAEEGPFEEVWVHEAAGDAGGAVGAALFASCVAAGDPPPAGAGTPLLGAGARPGDVRRFLGDCRVPHRAFSDDDKLAEEVAERLAAGQVGAVLRGRFEWGPRALGARSILADPRRAATRDRVNLAVKHREAFRPFAPVALDEELERWFDLGRGRDRRLLRHMGTVLPATEAGRAALPAVVHVDGSARVQSVDEASSPWLAAVLRAFAARTGGGVLLNTSLNLRGEPICHSPGEAYALFLRSDLDFLVLEDCVIERSAVEHSALERSAVERATLSEVSAHA